ncbi:hypothetical protein [Sporosarcina sp. JAI121]|uniref:hypothetical protein n=1 Tax=Sporosarcina sp. JAI121 TaxID=2723064 RepID=UPI0015CD1487|nr:hypothetical protein [Sporosarcina sp. JAI121]NYF25293.1 hypothetical protein [Sporosarcina sp. JAI121]
MYRKIFRRDPSTTKKRSVHWNVGVLLSLALLSLLVAACSETEPVDKNKVAIQTVLEHEFTAPDKEFMKIFNDLINQQSNNPGTPPDDTQFTNYLEKLYGPHFTEFGYDSHIMIYPLNFQVAADDSGYQITVDKIAVEQSEDRPRDYDFTVYITYKKEGSNKKKAKITGLAICPEEGKIGKIRYNRDYGDFEKIIKGDF